MEVGPAPRRPVTADPQRAAWAAWLRARMAERGLSLRRLAAACGVSPAAVQTWRDGGFPALDVANRLADALGVDVAELASVAAGAAAEAER